MPKKVNKNKQKPIGKTPVLTTALHTLTSSSNPLWQSFQPKRNLLIIIGVLVILALLYLNKGNIIPALVNGQPILGSQLNDRLNKLYRERVLQQIIDEKLIEQEANTRHITISKQDVQQKVAEAEKNYGGKEMFESLLSQQGFSREEFTRQTRLFALAEKLYQNEATVSAEEVKKFMDANADSPEATDPAKLKALAETEIRNQKLNQIIGKKFQELKQNAVIIRL